MLRIPIISPLCPSGSITVTINIVVGIYLLSVVTIGITSKIFYGIIMIDYVVFV